MYNVDTFILATILSLILSQLSGEPSDTFTQFFYISDSIFSLLGLIEALLYNIIKMVTKLPCRKSLLHSRDQEEHNDIKDYDEIILKFCE